ncbi:unnamed protein product [Bemisia tabaci]|uniref:Nucleolar protein of 40 kDa n=1 Tax=Bemisia tabaci TaxID=7038 RepID=A0A9P0A9D1_BEMTA|nr:unnamed protein product [Bemisia tabaci]
MTEGLLNSIFLCEVAKVHDYGAFVRIPDSRQQGLVHRSQVSSTRVDDVTEVLQRGERIWCKVISINDDGKIALSMKVVDQGSGRDLDPNGVQMHLDEQRKKKGPDYNRKRAITLDAVFNVTCAKCKTRGHLAKDCFKGADGKTYELLSDNEDDSMSKIPQQETLDKVKVDKKEKKKKKKRTKDEDEKHLTAKKKKKKEEKKPKKSRKRKYSDSSSSSSSSSSSFSDSSSDSSDHHSKKKKKRKKMKIKSKKSSKR